MVVQLQDIVKEGEVRIQKPEYRRQELGDRRQE
jgi:hypothetical protein